MAGYDKETAPNYRPSRNGLKTVVFYASPEKSKVLRMLALEQDMSLQELCSLATDEYLKKHKKNRSGSGSGTERSNWVTMPYERGYGAVSCCTQA